MNEKLKILWLDDECFDDSSTVIHEKAIEAGIELIAHTNAEDGIRELDNNIEKYDAVILDGIFLLKSSDTKGSETDKAIGKVVNRLYELKGRKVLPWFIFSGQESFTNSNHYISDSNGKKVYPKINHKDPSFSHLWSDIRKEAEKNPDYQLKHKHQNVFSICTEDKLGSFAEAKLLKIIKRAEKTDIIDTSDFFLDIRKVLELLIEKLNSIGLIPDEIYKVPGWFNPSCNFLASKHAVYNMNEDVIHPTIAHLLWGLKLLCQDAEHSIEDKLKLKVENFIKEQKTAYLYKSATYQLLDILVYFNTFIEEHPNWEENVELHVNSSVEDDGEWIVGEVTAIKSNGWGAFISNDFKVDVGIPDFLVKNNNLLEGSRIMLLMEKGSDKRIQAIKHLTD